MVQTAFNVGVDVLAISLLTYSSGGMNSGLGALLVLPIGAASFVVGQRLALDVRGGRRAGAAAYSRLSRRWRRAATRRISPPPASSARCMFIVTLGVGPLARSLRESEERVRQREVDVANLAELNQFIVQHLRESILVVDDAAT